MSAGGVSQAEVEQDFMPVILGYSCCWSLLVSWLLYAWCGTGTCLLPATHSAWLQCCGLAGLSTCSWSGAVLGHRGENWGMEEG